MLHRRSEILQRTLAMRCLLPFRGAIGLVFVCQAPPGFIDTPIQASVLRVMTLGCELHLNFVRLILVLLDL